MPERDTGPVTHEEAEMNGRVARHECPRWCVADHDVDDDPGEVRHRSASVTLPVVARARAGPVAADLMLEIHRSDRDATVWLYLGDGTDQRLEVTLESAGRLVEALEAALSSAAG